MGMNSVIGFDVCRIESGSPQAADVQALAYILKKQPVSKNRTQQKLEEKKHFELQVAIEGRPFAEYVKI